MTMWQILGEGNMAPSQFKLVGIIGRVKNPGVQETLNTLMKYLTTLQQRFMLDAETAAAINDAAIPAASKEKLWIMCDLIIVVGGDGSLLQAAQSIGYHKVPMLGINRGRLGFLTDIHPTELEKIKAILQGEYYLEDRFLLNATVTREDKILGKAQALNEVALIPDSIPHMNEFEIYIDEQFVCSQNSDGVIIATPTGSTAYALSGGGPILHPQLDAIVIVPMFPHTLSIRPIVIQGQHRITIVVTRNNTHSPRVACDGQTIINTPPLSHITIEKKPEPLVLIHPKDYDYYETLRTKLHWGHKLTYVD